MDQSLEEIIAEKESRAPRGGRRERRRDPGPRDGIRKNTREDSRNIDRDWVHDKFDDRDDRRYSKGASFRSSRRSPENDEEKPVSGTKIRVDNLHWDLNEDDVLDLFTRIGPVKSTQIIYDRAGRSTGRAFAIYSSASDADEAVRQFDGANANGQPIKLTLIPAAAAGSSGRRRNPFEDLIRPGGSRSFADRITFPRGRDDSSRSASPDRPRHSDVSKPPPDGIDRYVPGQRTMSPRPRRQESGRRPGGRGERNGRRGGNGERSTGGGRNPRPKKTQEELDQEMEDYFGNSEQANGVATNDGDAAATVKSAAVEDIEMAE